MAETCVWHEDPDGPWDTDCDHIFEFFNDGPEENGFKFCCYCGKPLVVALFEEVDDG